MDGLVDLNLVWQDYGLDKLEEGISRIFPERQFQLDQLFSQVMSGDILVACHRLISRIPADIRAEFTDIGDANDFEQNGQMIFPERQFQLDQLFSQVMSGDILGALEMLFHGSICCREAPAVITPEETPTESRYAGTRSFTNIIIFSTAYAAVSAA